MKGWEDHGGRIRVYFHYNNERCKESLNLDVTPDNIRYAEGLVATIRHEIASGTFKYSKHFPNSRRLKDNRIDHWARLWLDIKSREVAPQTYRGYDRMVRCHILLRWGLLQATDIDAIDVEEWISSDLSDLASKTIKDILSVFRMIYVLYRKRNRSSANPTDGISINLPDDDEPDAFTRDEIDLISDTSTDRESELNGAIFAMWSGPRPSEWMALSWDDVDLENREVFFRRAIVERIYKATKTKRSARSVDLLAPAVAALERQFQITGHLPPIEIKVLQRDNRTYRTVSFRPVFINTNTGRPFRSVRYYKWFWEPHLKAAGVRHRPVGMCRHAFASQMLTAGVAKSWIIEQLGHTTETMLRKKYGRLFKRDRRYNPADEVNKLLQL